MRPFSLLLAALVVVVLYLGVFERDRLLGFAAGEPDAFEGLALPGTEDEAELAAEALAEEPSDPVVAGTEVPAVSVVALRSEAEEITSAVIVRGQTEAIRQVELRAETTGQIVSEPLRRGARIETGDVLCRLDPGTRLDSLAEAEARLSEAVARLPEAEARVPESEARLAEATARVAEGEARVAEAQARLSEAEITERAAVRLRESGNASDTRVANAEAALESARAGVVSARASLDGIRAQIAAAEAGVESSAASVEGALAGIRSAEAAVAAAEREIGRLEITAPFSGLLESDTAELGQLLQPGGLCATVIQLDRIRLVGFLPETALSDVTLGAPAGARLATGAEVQGEVTFLGRSADPQTRTFRVEIEVPNPDLSIRDGQTAEILIATPGGVAHLVPQSALTLDDDGRLGLRLAEDGAARFYPVEILRDSREGVYVGGLPQSAEVIVVGQEYVADGAPVAVTYRGDDA